jgi:hypothetical protein
MRSRGLANDNQRGDAFPLAERAGHLGDGLAPMGEPYPACYD